jgi:hypothetical protein
MAITRIIKHHIGNGQTITSSLADRLGYGQDPDKTDNGELIRAYECDHQTADAEFVLSKAQYQATTGRTQKHDNDVLCYQIRQSFKPGEVTPEQANAIGYDFAMRWTKGKHAFFVATHIDRKHIHNHIYYNSTSLDCTHKWRDFIGSARAVRRLSDRICLENNLSVVINPKPKSKGQYKHYGEWLTASKKVNLIIDIQEKLRDGKGAAYQRWASVYNLKQMTAALQYLQENGLLAYEDLAVKAETAIERFHDTGDKLKQTETAMKRNADLKAAIADYARTRPIFDKYKAKKYSNKFLAEHESDIAVYRAAQSTMRELLNGAKLPKMDALKSEWQTLAIEKKRGYSDYRAAQKDMRDVVAVKANINHLLGITKDTNKAMER